MQCWKMERAIKEHSALLCLTPSQFYSCSRWQSRKDQGGTIIHATQANRPQSRMKQFHSHRSFILSSTVASACVPAAAAPSTASACCAWLLPGSPAT
jgi:hypothetical protein